MVPDYMNIIHDDNIKEDYSFAWAILNKAFDAEPTSHFNGEHNNYFYTQQIDFIDPDKIKDQVIIDLITVCVIRNNGKYKDYFLNKFPNLAKIIERAKPLEQPLSLENNGLILRNRYLKEFNIFKDEIY